MAAPEDPVEAAVLGDAGDVVVRATPVDTLTTALGLGAHELVALVGAGGKTGALQLLAEELQGGGDSRVGVTTTTAMFLRDVAVVAPVVMSAGGSVLSDRVKDALANSRVVAVARSEGEDGKVVGLAPAVVDELWAAGLVDHLIVEADGSRGRSLKAFAPHEPQVPVATTTIVLAAGLDAIGVPLDEDRVHRAERLAELLGRALGSEVTADVFADALRAQVRWLRRSLSSCRVVALLNKADGPDEQARGLAVALDLLTGAHAADGRSRRDSDGRPDSAGRAGPGERRRSDERPDSVVVASLRKRWFTRVSATEGRPG